MKIQTRLLLVKSFVLLSIGGSVFSLYTSSKGWGEIYPFFTWKLYSQPLGTQKSYTEYRIYSKKNDTCCYKRNKIYASTTFSTDEYVYTMNHLVERTLKDSLNYGREKEKLLIFVKHMVPNENEYKIVSEYYKPEDLIRDVSKYDTITIITF